ncbi:MAG: hypothetical protein IT292_08665 [Deltaproteobacteria bacterium]|nr:hypothetical protein [Deltaproteobacteria bacterium]
MIGLELFSLQWFEIFCGGFCVLAIFSFLAKENPFYRIFEHLFIGISAAILIMEPIRTFLWPQALKPLLGMDRIPFPDGTYPEPYAMSYLLFLVPMGFGLLYYFILSPRHSWLAQLVIGFSLGVGAGLSFKGIIVEMTPQLTDSFRPLYVVGSFGESLNNIFFIFVLLTVFSYFFFSFKRSPNGLMVKSSWIGRTMMMGCFGAFFGATIMARMALLVERLQFMIAQWWPALSQLWR